MKRLFFLAFLCIALLSLGLIVAQANGSVRVLTSSQKVSIVGGENYYKCIPCKESQNCDSGCTVLDAACGKERENWDMQCVTSDDPEDGQGLCSGSGVRDCYNQRECHCEVAHGGGYKCVPYTDWHLVDYHFYRIPC